MTDKAAETEASAPSTDGTNLFDWITAVSLPEGENWLSVVAIIISLGSVFYVWRAAKAAAKTADTAAESLRRSQEAERWKAAQDALDAAQAISADYDHIAEDAPELKRQLQFRFAKNGRPGSKAEAAALQSIDEKQQEAKDISKQARRYTLNKDRRSEHDITYTKKTLGEFIEVKGRVGFIRTTIQEELEKERTLNRELDDRRNRFHG